ncbi:MAG: hypothetical protein KatS3mg118_0084 [Paracoccaceae bacterium]|nr:MAG: hypothetical protein KatS3mg118_0084 [Paracoccaceae bacterium]
MREIGGLLLMVGIALVAIDTYHDLGRALLAASVPFGLAWFLHRFLADRPDSRAARAAWVAGYWLEDVDGAPRSTRRRIARYEAALAGVLDWLDARLSGPELERAGKESGTVALSRGLPDHCLILALVYPFGALLLQWAAGLEGRLGALTVLPAAEPLTRAATIGALGLSGFLYVRHQRSGPRWALAAVVYPRHRDHGRLALAVWPGAWPNRIRSRRRIRSRSRSLSRSRSRGPQSTGWTVDAGRAPPTCWRLCWPCWRGFPSPSPCCR